MIASKYKYSVKIVHSLTNYYGCRVLKDFFHLIGVHVSECELRREFISKAKYDLIIFDRYNVSKEDEAIFEKNYRPFKELYNSIVYIDSGEIMISVLNNSDFGFQMNTKGKESQEISILTCVDPDIINAFGKKL